MQCTCISVQDRFVKKIVSTNKYRVCSTTVKAKPNINCSDNHHNIKFYINSVILKQYSTEVISDVNLT